MKPRRGWVLFAAVTAAAVSGRGAAVGQSYGVGSQVLTIGVSEFKGIAGAASRIGDHGYHDVRCVRARSSCRLSSTERAYL